MWMFSFVNVKIEEHKWNRFCAWRDHDHCIFSIEIYKRNIITVDQISSKTSCLQHYLLLVYVFLACKEMLTHLCYSITQPAGEETFHLKWNDYCLRPCPPQTRTFHEPALTRWSRRPYHHRQRMQLGKRWLGWRELCTLNELKFDLPDICFS